VNLLEEDIAVAVRVGRLPDSSLVARKLCRPTTPADLRQHGCLVLSETLGPTEWHFQSPKGRINVKVRGRLCANNLDALVSAAIGGAGIARVPSSQVSADLSAGRLEALLTYCERPAAPVHAVDPGVHRLLDCALGGRSIRSARLTRAPCRSFAPGFRHKIGTMCDNVQNTSRCKSYNCTVD
jgi:DNA-binding transcriptional LysR family regulator